MKRRNFLKAAGALALVAAPTVISKSVAKPAYPPCPKWQGKDEDKYLEACITASGLPLRIAHEKVPGQATLRTKVSHDVGELGLWLYNMVVSGNGMWFGSPEGWHTGSGAMRIMPSAYTLTRGDFDIEHDFWFDLHYHYERGYMLQVVEPHGMMVYNNYDDHSTALGLYRGGEFLVQANALDHPMAYGWHPQKREDWRCIEG